VARDANLHACLSGRFANRIIAPYVSAGRLIGYQGRDWTNEHPAKYLNCKGMPRAFWNGDVLKSGISWVLVVEGVFDAFRYMPNVVACGGKPTDEQTQALTAFPGRVIVCLDPDASACAGAAWREAEALMMLMQLDGKSEQLISQILLPQGEDPGSIPVEWMRSEIRRCLAATPTC
jgi:DNA primase